MSVINKMLRDLDKQQQQQQHRGFASFKPQRKTHLLLWVSVPLALLVGWCGQAWYLERFSIKTEQAATAAEVQKGQLHPLAAVAELVPEVQNLTAMTNTAAENPDQVISLKDVVASRISPELAAQLGKPEAAPAAVAKPKLQPFANRPVAEERVVQVQMVEANTTVADMIEANTAGDEVVDSGTGQLAQAPQADAVQVAEFDQSADFVAEQEELVEPDWNDTAAEVAKPRSLAIEKVHLSLEQQKELLQQKAQKAEANGNLNQAVSHWQQLRQLEPASSQAYLELSRLAQVQRNDAGALQILEQASAAGVQDPKLSMAAAALAIKQQDWAKALSYLEYEPDIFNYTDFYALKAAALQKTNQHALSVQVFQQLARQQPQQARWWLGMALSYDALQQPEQALLAYRQVTLNGFGLSASSLDYVKKRIAALE